MSNPQSVTPLDALKSLLAAFRLVAEAQDIDPIDTFITVSVFGSTRRPLARMSLAALFELVDAAIAAAEARP